MYSELLKKLSVDIRRKFDIGCDVFEEVTGGWQNLKWRVKGSEDVLLKVFSNERYDIDKINFINKAMRYQEALYNQSVKVPKVYKHQGSIVQSVEGVHYMVMTYFDGIEKSNIDVTINELTRLGFACGQMHNALRRHENEVLCTDHFKNLEDYFAEINHKKSVCNMEYESVLPHLKKIYKEIPKLDFGKLKIGLTHSDFSGDNILFGHHDIRLVDFDRCRISYQNQDIGRAVMSYAFNGHRLEKSKVDAFIEGYSQVQKIDYDDIVISLKLMWIIEVTWWIQASKFEKPQASKIERFKEEILWLTNHWFDLENQIK